RADVPGTILAMLQARIGLLPAPARRVLRAASVLGETFAVAGVEALLEGGADEVAAQLGLLARQEAVEQSLEERAARRWHFRHALMRDAAYALFTPEDRAASHALAARHLERVGEEPAIIAAHCDQAGDRAGAIRHYTAAAELSRRRTDHRTT